MALLSADGDETSPWALWLTEPGIFLRCEADLDQVWSHLRKYTRLKTQDDRWVFFRFWDPVLLSVLSRYPKPLARFWARFLDGAELVIPDPLLAAAGLVLPADAQSDAAHSGGSIGLSDVPEGILRVQRRVALARSYVRKMREDPEIDTSGLSMLPIPDQLTHIETDIALAQREGLDKPDHVFRFVMLLHKARKAGVQGGAFASRARPEWTSYPAARKIAELEFDLKDILDPVET